MTASTRASLDDVLRASVDAGHVPGVVAMVVDRDSVLYRGASGVMDATGAESMRTDAIFRIASMTKPITSVGIMMLKEEGLLDLDDPASDYLPLLAGREVLVSVDSATSTVRTRPASRPISIRDLLRHTSGIGYGFSSHEASQLSSAGIVAREQPILHDPGARWTYGMGTAFLGWIIEGVSGQALPDFFESRILGPLGMDDTAFKLAEPNRSRLVASYRRVNGVLEGRPNAEVYRPTVRGDGGLLSTADDYARFLQLILRRGELGGIRLISEQSVAEMVRDQLEGITVVEQPSVAPNTAMAFPLGAGQDGFGLGFQVAAGGDTGSRSPGSLSWAGIQNTHFWIDPERGLGVVLLLQFYPFYDDEAIDLLTAFEQTLYLERAP
ncbi:MAG: serine hydrolase domain-containing protein [Gemmatimonadota bacterium]|nr:serine hydrolase domain-containing protein [Gemmatimonadota bacterium]